MYWKVSDSGHPSQPAIPLGSQWISVDWQSWGPGEIHEKLKEGGKLWEGRSGEVSVLTEFILGRRRCTAGGENAFRGTER